MPTNLLTALKNNLQVGNKILLKIRVKPHAKTTQQLGTLMSDGTLKINLKSPAENGKANQELIELLSDFFEVKSQNIKIISGKTTRTKLIEISKLKI